MRKRRPGSRVEGCRIAFVEWDPPIPEVSMPRDGEPRAIDTRMHDYFCSYQKLARGRGLEFKFGSGRISQRLGDPIGGVYCAGTTFGKRHVGRAGDQQ